MVSKTVKALAVAGAVGAVGIGGYFAWQRFGFGDVELATAPSGINVSVDNGPSVASPLKQRLPVGAHTLTVPATITDSSGQTLNLRWDDGSTAATRTVNIVSTESGVVFGNVFLATYTSGTGGQILGSLDASPSVIQDTQYFGVGAFVADIINRNIFGGCSYHVSPRPEWTQSDFRTALALTNIPGTSLVRTDRVLPVLITALDTLRRPMAGISVEIWVSPATLAPIDSRTVFQLVSVGDGAAGDSPANPIRRVTDSNGQAVVNLTPAALGLTYIVQIADIACSDEVDSFGVVPDQVDDTGAAPLSCPTVGQGVHIGQEGQDCGGVLGVVKSGFCCKRNGQAIYTTPVSGLALTTIHMRASGTQIQAIPVSYSQTLQVRLSN